MSEELTELRFDWLVQSQPVGAVAAGREHVRAVRHNQGVMRCLEESQVVEFVSVSEELFYGDCWGDAR